MSIQIKRQVLVIPLSELTDRQLLKPEPNIDRLALRTRPEGPSLMRQKWGKLLFMHWPIDTEILRPLIPSQLSIDKFDGRAWIGVVPFTMWGIRASFLPPIPGTNAFHELNVRTYVHLNGVPGVWFFSLDAESRLAVWGARTFYHLPYFKAEMSLRQQGNSIQYHSRRTDDRGAPAQLAATWTIGEPLAQARPGSLEFFLTERYCLYSYRREQLYRSRIFHQPWPLRSAALDGYQSTMLKSIGIEELKGEPLLHYAEKLAVNIWPLRKV